jgi:hypothetical protein
MRWEDAEEQRFQAAQSFALGLRGSDSVDVARNGSG